MVSLRTLYQRALPLSLRLRLRDLRWTAKAGAYRMVHPLDVALESVIVERQRPSVHVIPPLARPVLEALRPLPGRWHQGGTLTIEALEGIAHHLGAHFSLPISASAETGCGKSTVLLSHLSAHHTVFTLVEGDDSYRTVMQAPWTRADVLTVVPGMSSDTLPRHSFTQPLQFVLIDGPHAWPQPDLEFFYLMPHLQPGGILVVDDIHIPTLRNMFDVLCADAMFRLLEVVGTTAIFQRTQAPANDTGIGGWIRQGYNRRLARRLAHLYPPRGASSA